MPHDIKQQAEEALFPVKGDKRRQHGGFWDKANERPSIPTSNDPQLIERYLERQRQAGLPGRWLCGANSKYNVGKGNRVDSRYFIMEW